ncbi:MAG TPA: hypothetical protein PKA74_14215, partial [Bauldia sp.]|nr:hypothetical protein [Bauldia sp.]
MTMVPEVEIAVDAAPPQAAVSWGAIFAGTVCAAGLTLLLMVLGSGLGLSAVSPWPAAGATGATLAIGGIIWLVVTQWLSSAVGGYVAGRLRTRRPDIQADETFFRDSAHGLAVWATATLIVVAVLGSVAASVVGAGTRAVATVASGVAEGAGDAASALADPTAYVVDTMFRPGDTAAPASTAAAATASDTAAAPPASPAPADSAARARTPERSAPLARDHPASKAAFADETARSTSSA